MTPQTVTRNNLVLQEGNIVTELRDETVNSIPIELKLAIKRTPCRVESIQKESNFEMRYELFKRLNTGGEGLTRQEIRNCIFRGFVAYEKFSKMIKRLSQYACFKRVINISYSMEICFVCNTEYTDVLEYLIDVGLKEKIEE